MAYREENNYPKAYAATVFILAILLAISYFIVFKNPPKQEDGTGGILVNYGTTDEGMGNDYTSAEEISRAEKANKSAPDKVTPKTSEQKSSNEVSDQKVVTQNTEDAPVIADKGKKANDAVATDNKKAESKPVVNQNALYKGAKTTGTGAGDGNTNTPGNQGKLNGSTLTDNYDGTGSGNGGLPSNRHFMSETKVSNPKNLSGKIVVEIRFDKDGNITYAHAGAKGTTILDGDLSRACEEAAKRDKVSVAENAPDMQRGTKVYIFKLQ